MDGFNILICVVLFGVVCDDLDSVKGILLYCNECNFMKVVGDSGNLVDEFNFVDGFMVELNMDLGLNYVNG